jgi:diacylglycerol O-acyltransferase 1
MKYGFLLQVPLSGVPAVDFRISLLLFTLIPAHLFVSLWIEVWAARKAKKVKAGSRDAKKGHRKESWGLIRFTHIVNVGICLGITSVTVYTKVYHPLLGMICEMHAGTVPVHR